MIQLFDDVSIVSGGFTFQVVESYLPGDMNDDGKTDRSDMTSCTNYTGLRRGDADFEGYISNGDINKNDLINAYDISVAAAQIDNGEDGTDAKKVEKVDEKFR